MKKILLNGNGVEKVNTPQNQCMTTLQKMMLAIVTSTFGKAKYLTKLRYSLS
jgi:hypothetical protein